MMLSASPAPPGSTLTPTSAVSASNDGYPTAATTNNTNPNGLTTTSSAAAGGPQVFPQSAYSNPNFVAKDADKLLQEMMDLETSRYLSREQLFELMRERGGQIPLWVSSLMFKYALGVISVDKSREMSQLKAQEEEYLLLHKSRKLSASVSGGGSGGSSVVGGGSSSANITSNGGVSMILSAAGTLATHNHTPIIVGVGADYAHVGVWKQLFASPSFLLQYGQPNDPNRRRIENILDAIEVTYPEVSLHMAKTILLFLGPMAAVNTERESDVYFCLRNFVERLRMPGHLLHSSHSLMTIVGNFLCHFHTYNKNLYEHFFANEVEAYDWLPQLLISLFVNHLPQQQLLVMWGFYLMDGFQYHPFVLLAILEEATDDLLELDAEGIMTFLRAKPFPMRGGSTARGGGINAKALFSRAKALHALANKKEKLV